MYMLTEFSEFLVLFFFNSDYIFVFVDIYFCQSLYCIKVSESFK